MNENIVILEQFFSVVQLIKPITVHLFDETGLLLISFDFEGYDALDDFFMDDRVIKIEYVNLTTLNIQIDTSEDDRERPFPPGPQPGPTPTPGQNISIYLNGKKQTGDEVSFYAPIDSGAEGQMLISNGKNNAPSWVPFNGFYPTIVDDKLCFTHEE